MIHKWQGTAILVALIACPVLSDAAQKKIYQCTSVPGGASLSGGAPSRQAPPAERLKTYIVAIEDVSTIANPGLVLLAGDLAGEGQGVVDINGHKYQIPPAPGGLLAKIVVPIKPADLISGVNKLIFSQNGDQTPTWASYDAHIADVPQRFPQYLGTSYIPAQAAVSLSEFDFVINHKSTDKRKESETPVWAQRGKIRFYRAGVDMSHLDRMFEMFKEASINFVMLQQATPTDLASPEYQAYKAFFDRCHKEGIYAVFDGGAGQQPLRLNSVSLADVLLHPAWREWIDKDEYGFPRWRTARISFWPDLRNKDYQRETVKVSEIALKAGADAGYYDYASGSTEGLVGFFREVRAMAARNGKNWVMWGNCKGNIPVEELCYFTKSEGTEEAGVWENRWVNNVAQARFYYAAGETWKAYESKYGGAGAHDLAGDIEARLEAAHRRGFGLPVVLRRRRDRTLATAGMGLEEQ